MPLPGPWLCGHLVNLVWSKTGRRVLLLRHPLAGQRLPPAAQHSQFAVALTCLVGPPSVSPLVQVTSAHRCHLHQVPDTKGFFLEHLGAAFFAV